MILPLKFWPNPVLKEKAQPVTSFDAALITFSQNMAETMYAARGLGLAAPQVGQLRRVIVVDVDEVDQEHDWGLLELVNPQVTTASGTIVWEEGCLSFPGINERVKRPNQITVEYHTPAGEFRTLDASGILAVCIQHEIDHLDGINFIDRVSLLKRKFLLRRYFKKYPERAGKK